MKRYFLPLVAVLFSIFMSSCGDNPILDVDQVEKSDLTTPLFLAYDNTLDKSDKKVWAFNETEAAKATITVMDNGNLRIKTDWYFDSWSYSGKILSLVSEANKKTYELNQVSVLGLMPSLLEPPMSAFHRLTKALMVFAMMMTGITVV